MGPMGDFTGLFQMLFYVLVERLFTKSLLTRQKRARLCESHLD